MELRHHAYGNESRNRHYRRWKPVSDEVIYNAPRGYNAAKKFKEMNVKGLDLTPKIFPKFPARKRVEFELLD